MPAIQHRLNRIIIILCCLLICQILFSQSDTTRVNNGQLNDISISDKSLNAVSNKYALLGDDIDRQSIKLLKRMKRKEGKLQRTLSLKDSAKAEELFSNSASSYEQLQDKLKTPFDKNVQSFSKDYLPSLDSVSTSVAFLKKIPGLSPDKLQQLDKVSGHLQQLQGKLQAADEIKEFIKQRQQQLKDELSKYGLGKQLLGINKTAYYYSQQMGSYKELINDRKKLEEKLIATVREVPAFKSFWQNNSILSRLFPMPDNFGTAAALTGLQTTSQVGSLVQQRMSNALSNTSSGGNISNAGTAIPQQYIEQAQAQLNQLKDKVSQLGGTNGDMIMPDFQPKQRGKSFFKSLEYGINIQTQGTTNFLPAYTEIALTTGYKGFSWLRFGGGFSYKLGLGHGWNHIALTNEGAGLRTYLDIKTTSSSNSTISKLFGDIWLTAGQEYNYMQSFKSLRELHDNVNVWQKSFLAGVTKHYPVGKKEGKIQFLYDFLACKQVPRSGSAFKFRLGYDF